jgi:hypothetical protein
MKLNQVLEWIGKSPVNQLIVVGAAIVLLLLIVWLFRRRSSRRKAAAQAAARVQSTTRNELKDVFEAYRESHPAFYRIMSQIQANRRLEDFMSNNEFAGAIAKLRLWQAVRTGVKPVKQGSISPLTIQAESKKANPEVRAAMITVIRILYASPEITKGMGPATEAELDKLLESLTG